MKAIAHRNLTDLQFISRPIRRIPAKEIAPSQGGGQAIDEPARHPQEQWVHPFEWMLGAVCSNPAGSLKFFAKHGIFYPRSTS